MPTLTNFRYLQSDWPDLFRLCRELEGSVSARSVLFKCRLLIEVGLDWLFENEYQLQHPGHRASLDTLIRDRDLRDVMPNWQIREMDLVRREGNLAAHESGTITWGRAHRALKHTHRFLAWLDANYGDEPEEDRQLREEWLPPQGQATAAPSTDREAQLEEKLAQTETEIERLRRENVRLEGRLKDSKAMMAALKMKQDLAAQRRQRNTERGLNHEDRLPHPYSDAETRQHLVEVQLREAGWNPEDPNCTNEAPDYVLRDEGGVPIAVLETYETEDKQEAARAIATGHAQALAEKYGRKPQAFFSDGEQIWRCDGANAPAIPVDKVPERA